MGQDLELDFEKYCVVDGSPNTVLLSPHHSKAKKRKARKTPKCVNEALLSQNKIFTEISLHRYRSASCRDVRSTKLLKRCSVYQSSNEVGKMTRIDEEEIEGRKKIEFSRSAASFPVDIFDSLCGSDEDDGPLGLISSSFLEMTLNSIKEEEDHSSRSIPLSKSLSSRLELPHSPTKESNSSKTKSPKTRFIPFRKMHVFDSYVKSKSRKSLLGSSVGEPDKETSVGPNTMHKSLMNDFSDADFDSCSSIISTSSLPSHLNGVLKLENKNMMPYFEFSVKNLNDVLFAKTSKVGNGCDWVYTFHSARNRRKFNASGRGFKDLTTVGEMRVSCYLCTELVNAGAFDNSMVTEFVLYDLAHPKPSASPERICKPNELSDQTNVDVHPKFVADLHPDNETAAIVIQFPSEKRESLKNDNLLNLSRMKLEMNEPTKVSVVIPSGNHGLPSDESRGPSPLLDRWRLGGGCDCGGWDMGCPIIVLGNTSIQKGEACTPPIKLFLKGTKGKTPALTMKMTEDGLYAVDFHMQLTSLQAFSICVALLHSTEASISVTRDNDRELLQCDSLRVFVEDEVKHMIEAVVEEDKRRPGKNEIPPSFLVNPPFSPMSRA